MEMVFEFRDSGLINLTIPGKTIPKSPEPSINQIFKFIRFSDLSKK